MRFVLCLLVGLCLISCWPFPEAMMFNRTCIIKNNTDAELVIHRYFRPRPEDALTDTLLPQEMFRGENVESSNEGYYTDPSSYMPISSLNGDTIIFIFNNNRKIGYSFEIIDDIIVFSEPIDRNSTRLGSYEQIGNNEVLYTVTQEDFDNAVPCDGPCL